MSAIKIKANAALNGRNKKKNTKGGVKKCNCSKGIPEGVLEGAFVDAYNELCRTHKTSFKALYEDIRKEFGDEEIDGLIQKNEKKLTALGNRRKKLVDLKLSDGIDEKMYADAYEDVTGRINAVTKDIERLKGDKAKMDDMRNKLSSIGSMIKKGNEIREFNRYLVETMVEKAIVGERDDPYKIKFFLKTKLQYSVNTAEHILKNKVGKTINGITYQQQATNLAKQAVDKSTSTCGDSGFFKSPIESKKRKNGRHIRLSGRTI